jgi:hypothetical protein
MIGMRWQRRDGGGQKQSSNQHSQFSWTAIHSFAHGNFLQMSEISTLVKFMVDPRRENTVKVKMEHAFGTRAATSGHITFTVTDVLERKERERERDRLFAWVPPAQRTTGISFWFDIITPLSYYNAHHARKKK